MKNSKTKKRLIFTVSTILILFILLTLIGPYFVLMAARQPKVEDSYSYSESFYTTYDEIRDHLKERVDTLRQSGVTVEVSEYAVDESDDLYIDNIYLPARNENKNLIHIDIHSGYGPRYNMVIFNSVYETMTEAETKQAFGYDYVISHDSESFYATTGDTTDYFYRLAERKSTEKDLFSTCFEFGTIGDSFFDSILSLKYTVDENRQHWYPTKNNITAEVVKENYNELFYPTETKWREKTVEDFKNATIGVLKAKLK